MLVNKNYVLLNLAPDKENEKSKATKTASTSKAAKSPKTVSKDSSKPKNSNLNKRNQKGETRLHVACVKVNIAVL